jgi:hypothetical protein
MRIKLHNNELSCVNVFLYCRFQTQIMGAAYVRITNDESALKPLFTIITRLDWSYATIAFHCLGCVQLSTANISTYLTSSEFKLVIQPQN